MTWISVCAGLFFLWNVQDIFYPELGDSVHVLKQGELNVHADSLLDTQDDNWQHVTLPDNWNFSRKDFEGKVTYRFKVNLAETPTQRWGVYLPRVSQNAALYINDIFVDDGGSMEIPYTLNWKRPLLFELPSQMLQQGENTITLLVAGYAGNNSGLNPVYIGPLNVLAPYYNYHFATVVMPAIASLITMLGITVFNAWMWMLRPQKNIHRKFFVVSAIASLWLYTTFSNAAFPFHLFHWGILVLGSWFIYGVVLMVKRQLGLQGGGLDEKLFFLHAVTFGIVAMMAPIRYQQDISVFWHIGSAIQGIWILWLLWQGRHFSNNAMPYLVVMSLIFVMGGYDISFAIFSDHHLRPMTFQICPLFLSLVLAADITARFVSSTEQTEKLNLELNQRVEEKHRELAASYERLKILETQQAVYAERERIMRELHDGLGGHLLTALAHSEGNENTPLHQTISQALSELRLMIDTVDVEPGNLNTLLGAMRQRIEPLLQRHGGQFHWRVFEEPDTRHLSRSEMMHLLRIIQEVFTNIIKHAKATTVTVETSPNGVLIRDNGKGFEIKKPSTGRGLSNMRKRALEAGIQLDIDSDDMGTEVRLSLLPVSNEVAVC